MVAGSFVLGPPPSPATPGQSPPARPSWTWRGLHLPVTRGRLGRGSVPRSAKPDASPSFHSPPHLPPPSLLAAMRQSGASQPLLINMYLPGTRDQLGAEGTRAGSLGWGMGKGCWGPREEERSRDLAYWRD